MKSECRRSNVLEKWAKRIREWRVSGKKANEWCREQRNLHSDKYGAYEKLAKKNQIIPNQAEELGFRLDKIGRARSPEERLRIRQEKAVPIINELIEQVKRRLVDGKHLPKSKFRKALGYLYSLAPYMKNYTKNAWARLDNNPAERAVRPLALGRKNWLFIGNEDSGEAAATILSLVQTCRGLGINPFEYLQDVMRRLMSYTQFFNLIGYTTANDSLSFYLMSGLKIDNLYLRQDGLS